MLQDEIRKLASSIQNILRLEPGVTSPSYVDVNNNLASIQTTSSHVIFGRRGTGKSALLNELIKVGTDKKQPTIRIDCEDFKNHQFPDVIVEILRVIFQSLRKEFPIWKFPRLRLKLCQELRRLKTLLESQSQSEKSIEKENQKGLKVGNSGVGEALTSSRTTERETLRNTKLELIQKELPKWKEVLKTLGDSKPKTNAYFLIVDDFYHLPFRFQPEITDIIHRLCKGTKLFYKLATVRHRTQLYKEIDGQPVGVQIRHDFIPIDLDFSLEKFPSTSKNLRNMMA